MKRVALLAIIATLPAVAASLVIWAVLSRPLIVDVRTAPSTQVEVSSLPKDAFGSIGGIVSNEWNAEGNYITPPSDDAWDVGRPSKRVRDVFASGDLYASGTAYVTGAITVSSCTGCSGSPGTHIVPSANNTYDLGAPTSSWRSIYASTTVYVGSSLLPDQSNGADIGSLGFGFRDAFASGTFYLGTRLQPAQNAVVNLGSESFKFLAGYYSGSIYASTTVHGGDFVLGTGGRIFKSGGTAQLTTTSTFNFVLQAATGTNIAYNDYIRVPTACTIGAVYLMASSTPLAGDATIVDVNTHASMGGATTTIFTTQSKRPSLISTGLVTTATVPDVTALTAGMFLSVDIDQFRNHGGMQLQILCDKPLF